MCKSGIKGTPQSCRNCNISSLHAIAENVNKQIRLALVHEALLRQEVNRAADSRNFSFAQIRFFISYWLRQTRNAKHTLNGCF